MTVRKAVSVRRVMGVSAVLLALLLAAPPGKAQTLPADPWPSYCSLTDSDFAVWFKSGTPSLNGVVNPADSLHAPPNAGENCNFYEWALHQFLWVTSPASGGHGRVFSSPSFFEVSPVDSSGHRQFISQAATL